MRKHETEKENKRKLANTLVSYRAWYGRHNIDGPVPLTAYSRTRTGAPNFHRHPETLPVLPLPPGTSRGKDTTPGKVSGHDSRHSYLLRLLYPGRSENESADKSFIAKALRDSTGLQNNPRTDVLNARATLASLETTTSFKNAGKELETRKQLTHLQRCPY